MKVREAGVLVVALDTPFNSADSVDATFATDNFRAGKLIGTWARARMEFPAKDARGETLDGTGTRVTVEVLCNQGFLEGFSIDLGNPGKLYDEGDVHVTPYPLPGTFEQDRAQVLLSDRPESGADRAAATVANDGRKT